MNRLLAFIPAVALAALVAVSVFVLMRGGPRETISGGLMGRPAPIFTLQTLEGGQATNADLAGRPYVVNFFASYCAPCRYEHPLLLRLKQQGVLVVGIAHKDRTANTQAFLAQLGNPFTMVVQDPDGRYGLELGTSALPDTFVIGADGRVRAVHRGPLTPEDIERVIVPALRQSS